ncbi:MAG: hypothetical protein ACK5LN_12180 [Propioniciclava sp.]
MERLIEGVPGEPAQVWVQQRGGGPLRLRGEVMIEDLRPVLVSISSSTGANGPLNPVTQFMLHQASRRLADRLTGDKRLGGASSADHVPRLLSSTLGHQPFVESALHMSQHQMLRRWPQATAWYTDVIRYMLRATPHIDAATAVAGKVPSWARESLGTFIQRLSEHGRLTVQDPNERRVAEALQILWPDFPPVQQARTAMLTELRERWRPMFLASLATYGLTLRPGLDADTVIWATEAVHDQQSLQRLSGLNRVLPSGVERTWSPSTWASIMLLAGACIDERGHTLTPEEISVREPVRTFEVQSA